jgi:outer membrane exchange protein TraA
MRSLCGTSLFLVTLGWSGVADSAVQHIDGSQAAAPPRKDSGTGFCASTIHLSAGLGGLHSTDASDAAALLDKDWTSDPNITGRVSQLIPSVNLRNGDVNSAGDFTAATGDDAYFPFSNAAQAEPPGDDENIAQRLRGYFNVPSTLAGKTIAFGLRCDDLCVLKVGKERIALSPIASTMGATARMIYRVQFDGTGLYPIELLSYQNTGPAILEWSRTSDDIPECPSGLCSVSFTDGSYGGAFRLIDRSELYSAIEGWSSCQECGANGPSCGSGMYCAHGLCQRCDVSDHCGPGCVTCPSLQRLCSGQKCVQCTADDECAGSTAGGYCDLHAYRCIPPKRCVSDEDCTGGRRCEPDLLLCLFLPQWCTSDASCLSGQVCHFNYCRTPPRLCDTDANCSCGFWLLRKQRRNAGSRNQRHPG